MTTNVPGNTQKTLGKIVKDGSTEKDLRKLTEEFVDPVLFTTLPCPHCHKRSILMLEHANYTTWVNDDKMLVEDAFPGQPDSLHLLIAIGLHIECWQEVYSRTAKKIKDEEANDRG